MYEILDRPHGRSGACDKGAIVVRMRENRSALSHEARSAFAALAFLLLVLSIVPVVHGYWLVPAFSLAAVAALTFALERHQKQAAAAETLEVGPGRLRHADSHGRVTECEGPWLSFRVEAPTPSALRLLVRTAADVVEIGRCLSLDERRAVAPVIAAALDAATESRP